MSLTCLIAALLAVVLFCGSAFAQPGFVSIYCCAPSNGTNPDTKITWTPDNNFLKDVGQCKSVSFPTISKYPYTNARVFEGPHQSNCYKIPVVQGQDYLFRATFLYGPMFRSTADTSFKVLLGATPISLVNSSLNLVEVESVFSATGGNISACLVNDKGNSYISLIELRPLSDATYLNGSSSSVLRLVARVDLGNKISSYRYPDDPTDRIWTPQANSSAIASSISSDTSLQRGDSTIPLKLLQTAATDAKQLTFLHGDLDPGQRNYLVTLYFLELNRKVKAGQRVFDVYINGDKKHERFDILESQNSNYRSVKVMVKANGSLNISLLKASDSMQYGPICSAYEIFEVHDRAPETVESDAEAAAELRDTLALENPGNKFLNTWSGDPCAPPWDGIACEQRKRSFVITKLDLSSKGLQGPVPGIISGLTELKELDLQNNSFTGSIPESFVSLKHLTNLSISCNPQLNGQVPSGLFEQNMITLESGGCGGGQLSQSPQRSISFISSVLGGSVALTLVVGAFFTCFYKRRRQHDEKDQAVIKNPMFSVNDDDNPCMNSIVRSFSLRYIENATSNYKTLIGEGGFGAVYRGTLPHGEEVAVKVWSATSAQGTREFDNEVTLLSAVKHENLVPLLGYCCENDQQILVYPFMSNGSLQDRLYGEAAKRKVLDWPTRLSIALGAARGLMYLHNFAGRCIIHRDIKSSNILLDQSMCAKVADFGFSKYAPQEGDSGASLEVRGTAGYLDPEYYSTQQLSSKSDVFSFGVVLLEIVTGREPLNIQRPRNEWSLVEWAKPFIRESRIDEIVDPAMKGGYHAEAMWRVVETALACLEPFSAYRPNMVDIVRELEDSLIIENNASEYMRSIESIGGGGGGGERGSNRYISFERPSLPPIPSPAEPSPYCQILAAPQPR